MGLIAQFKYGCLVLVALVAIFIFSWLFLPGITSGFALLVLLGWAILMLLVSYSNRATFVGVKNTLKQKDINMMPVFVIGVLVIVLGSSWLVHATSGEHPLMVLITIVVCAGLAYFGPIKNYFKHEELQQFPQLLVPLLMVLVLLGIAIYVLYSGWVLVGY